MTDPDPTLRGQDLGERLRRLRIASGLTLADAGERIDASSSKLSRIECGKRCARVEDVAALLALYDVTGDRRARLLALAREVDRRGWWQPYHPDHEERLRTLLRLEAEANGIVDFQATHVPDLLQTTEYARALLTESEMLTEREIRQLVTSRKRRRARLREERSPTLLAITTEHALRYTVGGVPVQRRQLDHLLRMSTRRRVTLLVVPNSTRANVGWTGSFSVYARSTPPTVVFVDHLTSHLFLEDDGDVETYERAVDRLVDAALDTGESAALIARVAKELE
ncbi:helix-turn-helix transcriptional regulator [Allokutzneria multivorans]|uniref:Helix-turn-helix transcriptional regulator n=1 Tax=Allokutzneria multivorans TaxID=1142134 RepID=A0ABP7SN59_9PSEU